MSRLVVVALLATLLAGSAASQGAPRDALPRLVFDDLSYAAADWTSDEDRPVSERSVFGRNPWCTSLACGDTLVSRAWYHYLWREVGFASTDSLARLEPSTAGTGTLGLALLAGRHEPTWSLQLASGFSARTGVWAARADFSALPSEEQVRVMQSFWTLGTHQAVKAPSGGSYRGTQKGHVEIDFEFNNWFRFIEGTEIAMAAAWFENQEQATEAPLRGEVAAPAGSCRIRTARGERLAGPTACGQFLMADGVWTTMLFRSDGWTTQFELRAEGPEGSLRTASEVIEGHAPSQPMMTMMSQYSYGPGGSGPWTHDADLRVVFDWVYYAAEPDRSFNTVLADVATIQTARVDGRRVARLRTAPVRLARPYRFDGDGYERYVPAEVRIEGPEWLAPGRAAQYTARLDDVIGTFRLTWSERVVRADGSAGDWSPPDARPAYRYPTRLPEQAACLDIRVEAVEMQYTLVEDADGARVVEWVPPEEGAPLRAEHRVCHREVSAALRDTVL